MERDTIKFKDLSWVCKVGIIGGWFVTLLWTWGFIVGFIQGITS